MNKYLISILILCFSISISIALDLKITNGGEETNITPEVNLNDSLFQQLKYGECFALWNEKEFGFRRGPVFSNVVQTVFQDSLRTSIAYLGTEEKQDTEQLVKSEDSQDITTRKDAQELRTRQTIRSLDKSARVETLSKIITLKELKKLYKQLYPGEKMTREALLAFIREYNLLVEKDLYKLEQATMIDSMSFRINEQRYNELLAIHGLDSTVDLVQTKTKSINVEIEAKTDYTALQQNRESRGFESSFVAGKSHIILQKRVVQDIITNLNREINYSIDVRNVGEIRADNIILIDCLPKGLIHQTTRIKGNKVNVDVKRYDDKQIVIWKLKKSIQSGYHSIIYFDTLIDRKNIDEIGEE